MSGSQRKQALQHFQRLQDASYSRVHTACKYTAVAVGAGLENVTFDQLTTKPLYEAFGSYLALHAVAHGNGGNGALMPGTCLVYLNAFILAAEERADELARGALRDAAAVIQQKQQFFSCMSDAPTAPSRWLRGLRNRVRNHALGRRIECGLPSSHAAQPLYYGPHISKISEAYAKMGTTEAAKARALIMLTYAAAGRTAEAVYLTFESLNVDSFYGCLLSTIYQPKTGKMKDVPFVAARDRHADVALALADHFVLNRFKPYCPDDAAYVFPDVVMLSNPNDKLNGFIKNVNRCDNKLADPGIDLFEGACAAGIRRGSANELHSVMPAQFAVALTGHEMTGFTKLYEYINSNVANAITAATVLGRWPAPVFGHTTIGPRLPSVEAIIDIVGKGVRTTLEDIVDVLFNVDDAAPPMVMREGDGRPRGKFRTGLLHMLATLIMHSDDRDAAGEMVIVNETLRTAVARSVDEAPRVVISRWGRAIRRKFDADNHHLVAATATPEAQATVNIIAELAGQVAELSRTVAAQNEVLGKLTLVQECAIRRHSDGMKCNSTIDEMSMRDVHNDDHDTQPSVPATASALIPIGNTQPATPATGSALIPIGNTQPATPAMGSALIPIGDTQPAVLATGFDLLTGPQPDKRKETDANTDAQTLFLKMRGEEPTGGVGIAAQTLDRRKKVFHILMGFIYDGDEMKLMQSRKAEDDGKRRLLVQKLEKYFALFLACVYIGHNMKVPSDLQRALPDSLKEDVGTVGQKRACRLRTILRPFKVSTYENRNKDLLTKCNFVLTKNHKPDKKLLQAWRKAYEETGELLPVTPENSFSGTGEGSMSMDAFVEKN